jgi:ATP synthase protein I
VSAEPPVDPVRRSPRWEDSSGEETAAGKPARQPLSREEATALREREPSVSPWNVIAVQAALGVALAVLALLVWGQQSLAWSLLYGAATVVVPGALMARGMTSKLSSLSPGTSAASFMLWEMVKIAVAVVMLMLAPRIVPGLSWPALLVAMVLAMKVYWLALLWRPAAKKTVEGV